MKHRYPHLNIEINRRVFFSGTPARHRTIIGLERDPWQIGNANPIVPRKPSKLAPPASKQPIMAFHETTHWTCGRPVAFPPTVRQTPTRLCGAQRPRGQFSRIMRKCVTLIAFASRRAKAMGLQLPRWPGVGTLKPREADSTTSATIQSDAKVAEEGEFNPIW